MLFILTHNEIFRRQWNTNLTIERRLSSQMMKSLEVGYWVDEEPYELSDAFPAAQVGELKSYSNHKPPLRAELNLGFAGLLRSVFAWTHFIH